MQLWPIITAYAVGVSMNNFLPANIGTFVTLLMFVALIPGSNFPGIFAAYLVNKIFFTVVGGLVYLYLFLEAGSAFDVELGWFRDHGVLALALLAGGVFLLVLAAKVFWRWAKKLWDKAKEGGKILSSPRAYAGRVLLPQIGSYAAKVGVICVFLAAYSIPVTVRLRDERDRLELGGEHDLGHPRRRRDHAGRERRRAEGLHGRRHGDRLLALAAARDDGDQRRVRAPAWSCSSSAGRAGSCSSRPRTTTPR